MLTHPSQTFLGFGWPLDNSMRQHHFENDNSFHNMIEAETSGGSFLGSPSPQPYVGRNIGDLIDENGLIVNKKLNHNASERDRRKKINSLYASLRSLVPSPDHKKKLSIPATVSRVLKYIREIQKEVERLVEKREILSRKTCRRIERNNKMIQAKNKQKSETQKHFFVGSPYQLSDREIAIQIYILKPVKYSFSEVLLHLEQEGLKLLNMSSFESSEGRLFHNLHLQLGQGTQVMDLQSLREKLVSFLESRYFKC